MDILSDAAVEVFDGAKAGVGNYLPLQLGEPVLDGVEPGAVLGGKDKSDAMGFLFQKSHSGELVLEYATLSFLTQRAIKANCLSHP